jgi:hypothetical protein
MAPRTPGLVNGTAGPAARVRGLTREFDGRRILDGLDLDIAPGEFVAMLGVSGTGKSTLLRALAGLDHEVTGQLEVPGPVAVAFQEPRLLPWRRVLANVALGLRVPEPEAVARRTLAEVGLTGRAGAWPGTSPPCCWSPTTSTRHSCSPTGCSCWLAGASPSAARSAPPAPGTATSPGSSSSEPSCSGN